MRGVQRAALPAEVILLCVCWYLKFNVSYRRLTEMMEECGFRFTTLTNRLEVDHGNFSLPAPSVDRAACLESCGF